MLNSNSLKIISGKVRNLWLFLCMENSQKTVKCLSRTQLKNPLKATNLKEKSMKSNKLITIKKLTNRC